MESRPLSHYLVYEDGRIWSTVRGRFVKQKLGKNGYPRVWFSENGVQKWRTVHRIVALAFLGPSDLPQVNHKDGVKTNSHFSNLEWCTPSQNIRHALSSGLTTMDKMQSRNERVRKISREAVALADICQANGLYSFKRLGEMLGVHFMTIHDAIKRRRNRIAA